MQLPDADRLLGIPQATLRAIARKLQQGGLDGALLARLARVGERLDDVLRAPMRIWHARRMGEVGAVAVRLFMLHDPVSQEEAVSVLGDLAPLREAGLVEESAEGIVSRFKLALAGDLLCFGDALGLGAGSVLPLSGGTLDVVRAVMPRGQRLGSVLDVGCGAGAVGLLLARATDRVVATDIHPRALTFLRFNAALNGIPNVEARLGDALDPAGTERFDRIAVHPPFLARRAEQHASVFVHGGERGDELARRMLEAIPARLAEGGRAVLLADWPLLDGDTVEGRVRTALGAARVNVLVLQAPPKNLDEHCVQLAAAEHPSLDATFSRAAIAHRDHLEGLRLRGLALALVVLEPSSSSGSGLGRGEARDVPSGWTSKLAVRHLHDAPIDSATIDRLTAAHELAHARDDVLGEAALQFPDGARQMEQPIPGGDAPSVIVHPPPGRPEWPGVLTAGEAAIVRAIAGAPRVSQATPGGMAGMGDVLAVARKALLGGILDEHVASHPTGYSRR